MAFNSSSALARNIFTYRYRDGQTKGTTDGSYSLILASSLWAVSELWTKP